MPVESGLLEGKKALVSGAGRGIGKCIALAFAENGAQVALVSRTVSDVEKTAKEIGEKFHTRAIAITGDVSSKEGSKGIVEKAESALKGIDVLVCAAGFQLVPEIWEKNLHEIEEEEIKRIFETDVLGSFRLIKEAIPHMISQRKGVIIVFSSTPAIAGYGKGGAYTISKAANLGLIKEVAAAYGQYNIRAYAIAPGNIRTERTYNPLSEDERKTLASEASMKRWGEPEEVANVAVALASEKMSFVTGQTIVVDGGTVMV
ncbi:MAG: SDR family NAD(P)-dependent oxidoreductase [archaeon]|nr:SDR family NAD(P)-dependent oxidoreductase [archaeon]